MKREPVSIIDMYTERTGNVTVAHISAFVGGNLVSVRGASVKHPDDGFDPILGSALATARAMESLNRRVARYSSGLVKHQENAVRSAEMQARREEINTDYFEAPKGENHEHEEVDPRVFESTETRSSILNHLLGTTATTVTDRLRSFTEVVDSIREKVTQR